MRKKLLNWLIFLVFFALMRLASQDFFTFIKGDSGFFSNFLFVIYIVVCQVLVFPSGTPGLIYAVYLMGVQEAYLSLYFAGLISALINYWLGRKYGEPFLRFFLDEKSVKKVNHYSRKLADLKYFAVMRIFGFVFYKYVSYGAGILRMDFKSYFLGTVVFSAIPIVVIMILLEQFI